MNPGVLSPAQVVQGKVMNGELDDNHRTVRSKGNTKHTEIKHDKQLKEEQQLRHRVYHHVSLYSSSLFAVISNAIIGINHKRRAEFFREKGKTPVWCCCFGGCCLAWLIKLKWTSCHFKLRCINLFHMFCYAFLISKSYDCSSNNRHWDVIWTRTVSTGFQLEVSLHHNKLPV